MVHLESKPTFRALNEPHLILGLFDWRYAVAAAIPALFIALFAHSKLIFILAALFFEWLAYKIYSKDAKLPLVWIHTFRDKAHICPFSRSRQ